MLLLITNAVAQLNGVKSMWKRLQVKLFNYDEKK